MMLPEGYVLGIGNPLLDFLVTVDDKLCDKYNLKLDDAILAEEQHMPLYDEIQKNYKVNYAAGGATLNTIKMIQWILSAPRRCTFLGCIAADSSGDILKDNCDELQLRTSFELAKSQSSTGKCAVLLRGTHRTMVTYLGAAKEQTLEFVEQEDSWKLIENAKIYYIAGYVINSCFEGLLKIARHSRASKKLFSFNLSAPFLQLYFHEQVDAVLPYVDILFANNTEAEAYGQKHGLADKSLHDIALHLASIPPAGATDRKRIVILTQDVRPVIVAQADDTNVMEFPVPSLESSSIVDTTGAGDAFAAGFLAEYAVGASIEDSIKAAMKAARFIIQQSGFILGPREEYNSTA